MTPYDPANPSPADPNPGIGQSSDPPMTPQTSKAPQGASRCSAHSTTTGNQCGNWAMLGQKVCRFHGGGSPQARRAAAQRLEMAKIDAEVDKVLESGGKLPLPDILRCRVRYFTDGMAIGGKAFVERVFSENRGLFGPKRKDGARKMRFGEWGDLRTARALRVDAVRLPLTT